MARTVFGKRFRKGETIGDQYEIVRRLGEGGCGAVYRCKDTKRGGEDVAVKVLENPNEIQRFSREARVMRSATSPHVVRYIDRGKQDKLAFLVMEYMDGGSVRDLMDKRGKLPAEEAAWILCQVIRGLRNAGTVHRDLKPENMLLQRGTAGRGLKLIIDDVEAGATVKVADFGLAKSNDRDSLSLTQSGQVMGTPVYMSPEQCRNTKRVSHKTDIYALGVILYEMVSGKVPFDSSNVYDIMKAHCEDEPKLGNLPAPVKAICERCLQKSPGKRYPTLAALERDLSSLAGIRATGGGVNRPLVAFVIILMIIVGLGVAAFLYRNEIVNWYEGLNQAAGLWFAAFGGG